MNRPLTKVESSNIGALALENGTLLVSFLNGSQYAYENVNEKIFDEIVSAASVGRTFHQLVKSKPDEYPFRRVA